ncbi:MAG: hypothetical protein Q8O32_02125, partial [bacterium]|nr:hypothetical protein [bacterium]
MEPLNNQVPVQEVVSTSNQPDQTGRHLNSKLIIIVAVVLLLFGGSAYAWFFTDLRYKLPWFKPSEDKLVAMMYENLAKLDGVDFSLTYKLGVGDRDKDAKVDEKKVSDYEAQDRVYSIQSKLMNLTTNIISCLDAQANIQAFSSQLCDGSQMAIPKAGEKTCSSLSSSTPSFNLGWGDGTTWPDLSNYDWEYDAICLADNKDNIDTWSFSAHSTYNDDKIICTEKGCEWNNRDLTELGNKSSLNLDLLFGSYLDSMDDYISTNFNIEAILSGSGFSLKERKDNKQQLPNVGLGFDGNADLGSMSVKMTMEAKVIDDVAYFKVDAFPITDITKGHEGEWIKVDMEDNSWMNDVIPNFSENQNKAIIDFRNFIAKTKDYDVLTFEATGDYLEKDGIKSPVFEVNLIPANVPDWIQDLRNLYEKNKATDSSKPFEEKQYTEAEKNQIIVKTEEAMTNMKVKVALHPNTGDLMNLTVDFRIIPSADSKKFANKQFNSSLSVDLWNHNKPTAPKVPENFIEQSEIEREELGLSKEAYQDIKQSRRITSLRQDLSEYYNKNQTWP